MDNIRILHVDDDDWDKIVKSFCEYSVFYLSGYVKAFQLNGEGEPILFYYNDGLNRGMNVFFKRDISLVKGFEHIESNKYFDLITPYGYGGFIFDGDSDLIQKAYNNFCISNNIICEFVRFNLFSKSWLKYDGVTQTRTHNVVKDLNIDADNILMSFKHKVRKNIRQANENNLAVEICQNDEKLDDFLNIYYGTMKRNNAKDSFYFNKAFFDNLNKMKYNTIYFNVLYEGKVISTELVIYDDNCCYSYLGGTDADYFHLRPTEILKYKIIEWAISKKLKYFVLGGGYGSDDGIYEFKLGFAPDGVYEFYIGRKIFNNDLYLELCKEKNVNPDSDFFPAYRSN